MTARVLLEELLDGTEVRVVGTPEHWVKQMVRGFSRLPVDIVSEPDAHLTGAVAHHTTKLTVASAAQELETTAVVTGKTPVSNGMLALTLRTGDSEPFAEWEPGAHVDLLLDGAPIRQYSLCGNPADPSTYRLGILRDPEGRGSSVFVHDRLREGRRRPCARTAEQLPAGRLAPLPVHRR